MGRDDRADFPIPRLSLPFSTVGSFVPSPALKPRDALGQGYRWADSASKLGSSGAGTGGAPHLWGHRVTKDMALGSLLPGTGSSPTFMGSLGWQAGATFAPGGTFGAAVEVGWGGWCPCWTEEACVFGPLDIYEGKELAGNLPSLGASEMVKGLGERMGMGEVVMVLGDHLRKSLPSPYVGGCLRNSQSVLRSLDPLWPEAPARRVPQCSGLGL